MKFLSDPNHLEPVDEEGLVWVVLETPAGSANKVSWEPERSVFVIKKLLPAGMRFPHDFGFLPQTKGGDGDPLDVLVLMEAPGYPGCVVPCRLIGAFEVEQSEGEGTFRNDVLLAVAVFSQVYADVRQLSDLPQKRTEELRSFFENYHRLEGKDYRVVRSRDAQGATQLFHEARAAER